MADAKLTALSAIGTLGTDDLFYVVDDPGGSPLSRKATGTQVSAFVWTAPKTLTFEDASTNTVIDMLTLQRTSSGTPANDIGSAILFVTETGVANNENVGKIEFQVVDVTSTAEDSEFVVEVITAGTAEERIRLGSQAGQIKFGDITDASFTVKSTHTGTNGPSLRVFHDSASPAAGDNTRIAFEAKDGGGTQTSFLTLQNFITEPADGSETAVLLVNCITAGTISIVNFAVDGAAGITPYVENTATNTVTNVATFRHSSSGSPAVGIGVGVSFKAETAADNHEVLATLEASATNVGSGTEVGSFGIKTMTAGAAAATRMTINATQWLPGSDDAIQIGSTSLRIADIFLAEGAVINWDNGDATLTQVNNIVTLASAGLAVTGGACTETVSVLTDGVTPALDASLGNVFTLSATADRVIAVPSNAVSGQKIVIRHLASGGARSMTLNTGAGGFRFGTDITALTSTASGKTDYVGCIYNAADSFWDVVAYVKGF